MSSWYACGGHGHLVRGCLFVTFVTAVASHVVFENERNVRVFIGRGGNLINELRVSPVEY